VRKRAVGNENTDDNSCDFDREATVMLQYRYEWLVYCVQSWHASSYRTFSHGWAFRPCVWVMPPSGQASKSHPFQGLPGLGRDGAKVKKFHNFGTDDAPSTPHWYTSITPLPRALDEILNLTWAKLPSS
jgi:hypothetical protein